jgi:nucleoside-diphosphate-sugar epimerase
MDVLITGGTGFLGAYIIKDLIEKGHRVRAIRRGNTVPAYISPAIFEKVQWIEGDILDVISLEDAMEGVDGVIHAAAIVSFSAADRRQMIKINVEGTANVVNIAIEKNIKRFVHISSVASLGRTANGERVDEEKKWIDSRLNTQYAISKFHGELEVWRGIGEGLPAVIVNPSTILGYGDWNKGSCAIFKNAWNEFPWYTNGVNGFVDVVDVAAAVSALLESEVAGKRFIVNGDNWSFHQLFDAIAEAFGKKKPSKEATPFLGAVAWRVERFKSLFSGRKPLLTKESAKVAQSKTYFDNTRILKQIPGFAFTPLEDTIRKACRSYQEEFPNPGTTH